MVSIESIEKWHFLRILEGVEGALSDLETSCKEFFTVESLEPEYDGYEDLKSWQGRDELCYEPYVNWYIQLSEGNLEIQSKVV